MAKQKTGQVSKSGVRSGQSGQLLAVESTQQYSGPLPDPVTLEHYERVYAGTAERILVRFEKEADHRQTLERQIVDAQINRERAGVVETRRGQVFAFILGALGMLVGGVVVIVSESTAGAIAGASIAGVTLVGIVTAFITGRRAKTPSEGDKKAKS